MRYSLYNHLGQCIGKAETAQGIADLAIAGTFSYDTQTGRVIVWRDDVMGLLGSPVDGFSQAVRECRGINKEKT